MLTLSDADGVDSRRKVVGNHEREIGLPAEVVDVVLVEVDGGIVLGGVAPAHLAAVPGRAGHRPRRQVDQPAS